MVGATVGATVGASLSRPKHDQIRAFIHDGVIVQPDSYWLVLGTDSCSPPVLIPGELICSWKKRNQRVLSIKIYRSHTSKRQLFGDTTTIIEAGKQKNQTPNTGGSFLVRPSERPKKPRKHGIALYRVQPPSPFVCLVLSS